MKGRQASPKAQAGIPRRANIHPLKGKQASPEEQTDFHGRADDYARAVSVISPEGLTSGLAGIPGVMARMVLG